MKICGFWDRESLGTKGCNTIRGRYRGYIGIKEKKMETTSLGLGV